MKEKVFEYVKNLSKNKTARIIAGVLAAIIIIAFIGVYSLNSYLESDSFKKRVNAEFSNATDLKLAYDSMDFKLAFPLRAQVDLKSPVIHYADNSVLFSADYLKTQVELLPLIFKTVEVSNFDLKNPDIFLQRNEGGVFLGLEKLIPQEEESDEIVVDDEKSDNNFNVVLHNIKINDYKISFIDAYAPKVLDVLLHGNLVAIDKFEKNKYVAARADGVFSINGKEHFRADADLKLNLASIMKNIEDNEQIEPSEKDNEEINPFYEISKNNLKANLSTKLMLKNTDNIKGNFDVTGICAQINNYQLPQSNLNLDFKGSDMSVVSKLFVSPSAFLDVNGKINYKKKINTDLTIKSSELKLKELKDFAMAIGTVIPDFDISALKTEGSLKIDANIKSTPKSLDCSGFVNLNNILLGYEGIKPTLNHLSGKIVLNEKGISLNNIKANLDKSPLSVSGNIDNKMNADIVASVPNLDLSSLLASLRASDINKDIKNQIDSVQSLKGNVSTKVLLKGKVEKIKPKAEMTLSSFYLKHKDLSTPLSAAKTTLMADDEKVTFDIPSLFVNSSKSSLKIKAEAELKDKIKFIVNADGALNESDITKLLGTSGLAKGSVPVFAEISGTPDKISTKVKVLNTSSNYLLLSGLEQNTNIVLDGILKGSTFEIVNTGIYTTNSKKLLDVSGKVTSINKKDPNLKDIRVHTTTPIKLNLPIGITNSAFLGTDLKVNGSLSKPKIDGYVKVQNLNLPQMSVNAGVIDINIDGSHLNIKVPNLKAKNSSLALSAEGPASFNMPYQVSKVTVVSPFLNIDEIAQLAASIPSSSSSLSSSSVAAASAVAIADSPVIIKTGTLSVDKLILNNTEFSNLSSKFALNKKYDAILSSLKTSTMGGIADGNVVYNLMNGSVDMKVNASNINSDTFAVKFLGMPSKTITGLSEAKASLKFSATSPEQITKTLNGNVDFSVSNGEMGSLGRLDFYLNASNIISNNAVSNALNKVINLSTLSQTGKFDRAYGKLAFYKGGMMKVNHFKTEGPKMSLYIKGDLNDINFKGDLQIMGRLSEDMVQSLGPLSQAAMDKVMSKLSPLTDLLNIATSLYQTTASDADKKQLPLLSGDNEGSAMFLVKINGDVFKPSSVKMFKWVTTPTATPSSTTTTAPGSSSSDESSAQSSQTQETSAPSSETAPKRQVDVEKLQQLIKDPKQILLNF